MMNSSYAELGSEEQFVQVTDSDSGCGEFPDIERMKVRLTHTQLFYFGQKTLKNESKELRVIKHQLHLAPWPSLFNLIINNFFVGGGGNNFPWNLRGMIKKSWG